ncbi:MAG: hypothetical protein PHG35_03335 [Dehalococcoidales bacterium]|nr:hypothetical protein [Dehalococcoidales bacterium]
MAGEDQKISELTEKTSFADDDILIVNDSEEAVEDLITKKLKVKTLLGLEYQGRRYTILNPYKTKLHAYKGQLHAHTTNSDGDRTPAQLAGDYLGVGCAFMFFTDHNYLTPDPAVAGILGIPGVEESNCNHILNLFATAYVNNTDMQTVIDTIDVAGALAGLPHTSGVDPKIPISQLRWLRNYCLFEIRNAVCGEGYDWMEEENKYDKLLSAGMPIWCTTVDDYHSVASASFNKYFVVCFADACDLASIKEALRNGNFYCMMPGAPAPTVTLAGNVLTITTDMNADFTFIGRSGLTLQSSDTDVQTASYTITGKEQYVRCRIVKHGSTETSWTQPLFINKIGPDFDTRQMPFTKSYAIARQTTDYIKLGSTGVNRLNIEAAVKDFGYNFSFGDWWGATGAYRQADADSDSTHIQDDDAVFVAWVNGAYVQWSSAADGVANAGTGIATYTDVDTLTITKISGADFAASYYYYIKKAYYTAPISGWYAGFLSVCYVPLEADKSITVYFIKNGVTALSRFVQHSAIAASGIQFGAYDEFHLDAGDIVTCTTFYSGTVNTVTTYGDATILYASHYGLRCLLED